MSNRYGIFEYFKSSKYVKFKLMLIISNHKFMQIVYHRHTQLPLVSGSVHKNAFSTVRM